MVGATGTAALNPAFKTTGVANVALIYAAAPFLAALLAWFAIGERASTRTALIKEYEAGVKAQELCRKYGISDATFYKYKARFGGMNASDAKKLRALEDENNRLKRMLADAMLDNAALKDLATKNY